MAEFPDLFSGSDFDKEAKKVLKMAKKIDYENTNAHNEAYVNRERAGVGPLLPL